MIRISRRGTFSKHLLSLIVYVCLVASTTARQSPSLWRNMPRGGATTTTITTQKDDLHKYRWQQQMYLQSRSLQLRQGLIARGLDALQHTETETKQEVVDWESARSTDDHPKSCLFSFEAQPGCKVVAPLGTTQWITLTALNRLRRQDATKIEPLWHQQYAILSSWFSTTHPYSLYTYLPPTGQVLAMLLDAPVLLLTCLLTVASLIILLTLPVWEEAWKLLVTHPLVWQYWPQWGRFLHAALPLKLLLGQMVWKAIATVVGRVYGQIRTRLVEWECQLLEESLPLTLVEDETVSEESDDDELGIPDEEELDESEVDDEYDEDEYDDDDEEY